VRTVGRRCLQISLSAIVTARGAQRRGNEETLGESSVSPSRMTPSGRLTRATVRTVGHRYLQIRLLTIITAPSAQRHGERGTSRETSRPADGRFNVQRRPCSRHRWRRDRAARDQCARERVIGRESPALFSSRASPVQRRLPCFARTRGRREACCRGRQHQTRDWCEEQEGRAYGMPRPSHPAT
jgi:hypothetical protein